MLLFGTTFKICSILASLPIRVAVPSTSYLARFGLVRTCKPNKTTTLPLRRSLSSNRAFKSNLTGSEPEFSASFVPNKLVRFTVIETSAQLTEESIFGKPPWRNRRTVFFHAFNRQTLIQKQVTLCVSSCYIHVFARRMAEGKRHTTFNYDQDNIVCSFTLQYFAKLKNQLCTRTFS